MTLVLLLALALQFSFARLEYQSDDALYPGLLELKNWFTDYNDSDNSMDRQLTLALRRGTAIDVADSVLVRPASPRLFKFPLVYAVEPEQMTLSTAEAANLREYLSRGGFFMADDFHGRRELEHVQRELAKAGVASYELLTPAHALFHTFYDIDEIIQVPVIFRGQQCYYEPDECYTYETSSPEPVNFWASRDDKGRINVLLCQNIDLGDGLEWADQFDYPVRFTKFAYMFFTNVIMYVLSH